MPIWTEEQEKAIAARGSNLLVSAAAGSGKTAVLVERIIQLIIKDKIDIDRLLIVTFTHAAAGEMRERISLAIMAELDKRDENEEHLRRQLNLLPHSSISTLHAFCTDVVRKFFYLIDVDPHFRIADVTETELMKQEVVEELFEEEYQKASKTFFGLVEIFGGSKDDIPLQDLVLRTYNFIQSKPFPQNWLEERVEDFALGEEDFIGSPWVQALLQEFKIELSGAGDLFSEALELCEKIEGPQEYREAILDDLEMVQQLSLALETGLFSFYSRLKDLRHQRLKKARECEESLKEMVRDLRDQGKKILKDMQSALAQSPSEYLEDLHELYPYMKYLSYLSTSFSAAYREKKSEKGIVDFNDLEHYALDILADETIAAEYHKRYLYIFVDEYQDSNQVQESILNFIRKEDNLFLVGDVKQSIYRFRLADPSLFLEKYELFQKDEGVINHRIDLNRNFRSQEGIINAVNSLFRHIMSRDLGEIHYDEHAYLYAGRPGPPGENESIEEVAFSGENFRKAGNEVELCLIEKDPHLEIPGESEQAEYDGGENEGESELEEMDAIEAEARYIARRIKELLAQQIYDPERQSYRNITYKDIVVLLRSTRSTAGVFLESFLAEEIPAYADLNSGYFEVLEVNIFMNLLRLIDNKRQDIPLLSVMRSPIAKFAIDDLIKIRIGSTAVTFFEALEEYMEKNENQLKKRLEDFVSKLQEWKEECRFLPLDDFIWKLLMESGYYYYAGAMPGGRQRQANLRVLFDRARQFQNSSLKGLFNFIRFADRLKSSSGDMGTARIMGENDDVVRIMSVHKSKGLEFPVVILAGMGKGFNFGDTSAQVLFHKDLGIGPRYVNPTLRVYTDTIARIAMKKRIKLENLAEEMRILYVACTRPQEKLIMVGSARNIKRQAGKWSKSINSFNLSRGKNYLDWVGPVLIRHKDGEKLRELAGVSWGEDRILDEAPWRLQIIQRTDIRREELKKLKSKEDIQELLQNYKLPAISAEQELVAARLNWKYEYQEAVNIPSKLSVSQIKKDKSRDLAGAGINIPPLAGLPVFMQGKKDFSPAKKGSILHLVMQHLDWQRVGNREEIAGQIKEMVNKEILREEEARAVYVGKILRFFHSPLGKRVLQAENSYREVPFNLLQKAGELFAGLETNREELLIQGVIDLYFQEGDKLVLVDYKTDWITPENRDELIERYRIQLELYKNALEKIQGLKVKENYLYFFHVDEAVLLSRLPEGESVI